MQANRVVASNKGWQAFTIRSRTV